MSHPPAPQPFGPKYQAKTITGNGITGAECVICGRNTAAKKNTLFGVVVGGGSRFAHESDPAFDDINDPGYMGAFPVGSECAKAFPAGYLAKENA